MYSHTLLNYFCGYPRQRCRASGLFMQLHENRSIKRAGVAGRALRADGVFYFYFFQSE